MLASLPAGALPREGWIFEPKLDGIRCLAVVQNGVARLLSRRGLDLTSQYPALAQELPPLVPADAILDGEIIALDAAGRPSFQRLQQRMNLSRDRDVQRAETMVPVQYFVFDLMHAGDFDLTGAKLSDRKHVLEQFLTLSERVRLLSFFESDPDLAYEVCVDNGFEGIVAKRGDSLYECGRRSPSWLKVKAHQTAEFVIGGYTKGQGSRTSTFGALLLGYFDEQDRLIYCGSVGTGFDQRLLNQIQARLEPLESDACPFLSRPNEKKAVVWTSPSLVIEVKYMDMTRDGHLRTPVFMRFRDDKAPTEVRHPDSQRVILSRNTTYDSRPQAPRLMVAESSGELGSKPSHPHQKVLDQLSTSAARLELIVDREKIPLTHLDKVLWPKTHDQPALTKLDYLRAVCTLAPYLLPHCHGRPLTLWRCPHGIGKKGFFQKHWDTTLPEYVETVLLGEPAKQAEYLLCNNLPSLLFFAQSNALEFHIFPARVSAAPDEIADGTTLSADALLGLPDFLILDLDFHMESGRQEQDTAFVNIDAFKRVCLVALTLKQHLDAANLASYVKTSGRNGLHILVPIKRNSHFATTNSLAQTIAQFLVKSMPNEVTTAFDISKRAGKIYIDTAANGAGKSIVCAYSPRAVAGAPISAPVHWSDLIAIHPTDRSLYTVAQSISALGDPWADIVSCRQDLHALLAR